MLTSTIKVELVKPQSLELHPYAHEVLEMSADQYAEFLVRVKKDGHIREPIKRLKGTSTVIDGRTRLKASLDAGFALVPVIDVELGDEDPVLYMLSSAVYRRHFTAGQRAAQGAKYLKRLKVVAKERQKEGAKKGGQTAGRGRPKEATSSVTESATRLSPGPAPKSRELAARLSGSNPKAVAAAAQIAAKAPAVFDRLATGEIELPEAKKAAGLTPAKPAKSAPAESIPAGAVTLSTALIDLLDGKDVSKAGAALESWNPGVPTVEKLLTRCPSVKPGESYTSRLYAYLREIPGLGSTSAHQIGDALVDAGFVRMEGPCRNPQPTAKLVVVEPEPLAPCPFCGSKDVALVSLGIYVTCRSCMACGPSPKDPTPVNSRDAWNKRAKSKTASQDRVGSTNSDRAG